MNGTADAPRSVLVVGAGVAALRCVQALRRNGFVGRLTLLGEELRAPYDRPPLSKGVLTGRLGPTDAALCTRADLHALDVDFRSGARAVALEHDARQVCLADGSTVDYDRVVIATGATPRVPELARGRAHVLRTIGDAIRLSALLQPGARVCVIGGGVLGCEIGASARERGCAVTVVEALPEILGRALGGGALAAAVRALHRDAGVEILCGSRVAAIEDAAGGSVVRTEDGREIAADVVVVASGVVPTVEWLAGSGLLIADGVVCDEYLAADDGAAFAVGDVARWRRPDGALVRLEHWSHAVESAETVAHNALAPRERWIAYDRVPSMWSDQHGTKIQTLGSPARSDSEHVLTSDPERRRMLVLHGAGGRVCGAAAMGMTGRLARLRPLVAEAADFDEACRAVAS